MTIEARYVHSILEGIQEDETHLQFQRCTAMKKIKPSDLRREAQAMIRDGSMPSLETLLQTVADAREKYAQQIAYNRLWSMHPDGRTFGILSGDFSADFFQTESAMKQHSTGSHSEGTRSVRRWDTAI